VKAVKEFHDEFPTANRRLQLPAVSIFADLDFTPQANPIPVKKPDPGEPVNSKFITQWRVGDYDGIVQLDLWAGDKEERDDLTDALFNALNPNIKPMGLTLQMNEYFNVLCDYLYVGHKFEDTEISSQTGEWRTKFEILVTCKAVREREEFIIESTELDLETANLTGPFIPA